MNNDVSIVFQGPPTDLGIAAIEHYKKFGRVIVAIEKDHVTHEQIKAIKDHNPHVFLLIDKADPGEAFNNWNVYHQMHSTMSGLAKVATKYVVKVRSDECYPNLQPFIDTMRSNPGKLVTGNVFFRPDREFKFHPSDHLIGCDTDTMKKMYVELKRILEGGGLHIPGIHIHGSICTAEQHMCLSFLQITHRGVDPNRSKEIMKEAIRCVPMSSLGHVFWTANCYNLVTDDQSHPWLASISNMDEL